MSFDDKEALLRKVQFIRAMNLGGGMIWALDLDDFKNRCGHGHHPLLTAIREGLRDAPNGVETIRMYYIFDLRIFLLTLNNFSCNSSRTKQRR